MLKDNGGGSHMRRRKLINLCREECNPIGSDVRVAEIRLISEFQKVDGSELFLVGRSGISNRDSFDTAIRDGVEFD